MTEYRLPEKTIANPATTDGRGWLKTYYFTRAAFSVAWVAAAFTLAHGASAVVGALLLIYPVWDAAANLVDGRRNGGLRRNPTQALNAAIGVVTTAAVAVALTMGMNPVLGVFGVWASLAGLLQLATALRRRKSVGAQWPMILSGAQSTIVGATFVHQALAPEVPSITAIAPYAAFGAVYFLISALWLTRSDAKRH